MREDLAEKIVHCATSMEAKNIASAIKKHDSNWHDINYSVMKEVLIAKLKSNSKFRDALLLSEDKILVETQPDTWWGCGLPYHIAVTTDQLHYPGLNKLGKLLMELRSEILEDPLRYSSQEASKSKHHIDTQSRSRTVKRSGSKVRSLSFNPPKGYSMISGVMPLIKEMFHRQSRKRTRVVSPSSKSQSECSDVDDASSVASFTSANDDNETSSCY